MPDKSLMVPPPSAPSPCPTFNFARMRTPDLHSITHTGTYNYTRCNVSPRVLYTKKANVSEGREPQHSHTLNNFSLRKHADLAVWADWQNPTYASRISAATGLASCDITFCTWFAAASSRHAAPACATLLIKRTADRLMLVLCAKSRRKVMPSRCVNSTGLGFNLYWRRTALMRFLHALSISFARILSRTCFRAAEVHH